MTRATAESDLGPWERISLNTELQVSLWVQLKTQLQYLISTGEIAVGTKLPPVRQFANHLGIAVDTVRKAYDEVQRNDMVRTIHGVGTFTSLPHEPSTKHEAREDPWERVDQALLSLVRSGSDVTSDMRHLGQRLAVFRAGVRAVFFGVPPAAARYARLIQELLPDTVSITSADINDLRDGRFDTRDLTHAISLPLHRRDIEAILADVPVRCLTLVSKLAPGLADQIPVVGGRKLLLVARPETATIYTNILAADRPDLAAPVFVSDTDEQGLRDHVADADVILHTTVATDMVHRVAGAGKQVIELRHVPDPGSLTAAADILVKDQQLHQTLLQASAYRELL